MELTRTIKQAICALFEVHADEGGVQRVVTPLQYSGSGDHIVVRVRANEHGFTVDENGESSLYASMADGDVELEAVQRWLADLPTYSPVSIDEDEVLRAHASDERLIPAYIFRVAEAAQSLYALATARQPRKESDFKKRVAEAVEAAAATFGFSYENDVMLPIAGDFKADHVISSSPPLIVIAATGIQRLLEAEIVHMRYQQEGLPGFVLATVESQRSVGAKQFERANYYTGKTVSFSPADFSSLLATQIH